MTGPVALDPSARMSDDDWPGVLLYVSEGQRIAVNAKGNRYSLQASGAAPDGSRVWVGRSFARLSSLVAAAASPEVAKAASGLPDDPAESRADLQAARSRLLAAFDATDWRRDEYPRAVWQHGNYRVIVTPCGSLYRGQWRHFVETDQGRQQVGPWLNRWAAKTKTELARLMAWNSIGFDGADGLVAPDVFLKALDHLPENVTQGEWPDMPQRPVAGAQAAERE